MNKNVNHRIRKHFNEWIYNAARYTEIVLSIVILIVIALAGIRLIYELTEIPIMDMDIDFFTQFLANALSLVVGVEFVKMLCQHSAQTVVEVPDVCDGETDGGRAYENDTDTDRCHRYCHPLCHQEVSDDRGQRYGSFTI